MHQRFTWFLFACVFYLIVSSITYRWLGLPGIGNIGFTLVFTAFSLSHASLVLGWKRAAVFFALSAVVSWFFEQAGVATGAIYGAYHYGDMLGVKLGHVPVVIPLAWFMMIYPAWMIATVLLGAAAEEAAWRTIVARAFVGAMVITMWDTVMDPGMAARGNWVWEEGGPYFGVPFQNFFGWVLTTFTVYLLTELSFRLVGDRSDRPFSRFFLSLPVVVYTFYAGVYMVPRAIESLNALRVVAVFTMGFAGSLALLRLLLGSRAGYPFNKVQPASAES